MPDARPDPLEPLDAGAAFRRPGARIDERFRAQVLRHPQGVALEEGLRQWRYAELDEAVEQLARVLAARLVGTEAERPVHILGARRAGLVVAVLAAVRIGRPFVVADASQPPHRLQQQFALLDPALVIGVHLGAAALRELLPGAPAVLSLVELADAAVAEVPVDFPPPSRTAYLLFTSGTTGVPKGIRTGHAPLLHFLRFYERAFAPAPEDRFALLSGLGHDPMLRDLFVPLSIGATLCIPDEALVRSPLDLYEWLQTQRISVLHCTPQLLRLAASGQGARPPLQALRLVFSGGDALLPGHVQALRRIAPQARLVNFYGSSETPQAMGFHEVGAGDMAGPVPLGRGIDDVQLLVLRPDRTQADVGEVGEIGIRTHFLSDGYLGDQGTTGDRYIASPFLAGDNARIYLTGDLGWCRPDGAVVGAGRADDQVKIRGYRVELGDVSAAIDRTGLVANAALLAPEGKTGERMLVAFVVPAREVPADGLPARLRATLSEELPSYMVPARVLVMDRLPLNANAKVDRQALQARLSDAGEAAGGSLRDDPGLDDRLRALVAEIEDALETTVDRLDRSFVDLGGDSLSYVRVSMAIEELYGRLPDRWEEQPLSLFAETELADAAPPVAAGPLSLATLELSVLLRCVSILLVVMTHAGAGWSMAATSTLFVVSGINFERFIAPAIRRGRSLAPLWHFVVRFAIPAGLWQLLRSVWVHAFWLPNILLMGTFFQNPEHPVYTFWYLDVLAANVVVMGLITRALSARRRPETDGFREGLVLLALACGLAVAQSASGWWDGEIGKDSVAPFKWLWLLVLGSLVTEADTSRRKWLLSAVAGVVCAAATAGRPWWPGLAGLVNAFLLLSVWALIWFPRVSLPRVVKQVAVVVASSTLFIYIVNYSVIYHLMPRLGLPAWMPLQVALAVAVGVVMTRAWDRVTALAVTLWRRRPSAVRAR